MSLKVAVFLVAIVQAVLVSSAEETDLNIEARADFITEKVTELIEKLKKQMKDGIPEANIPPLDPLVIPGLDLGPLKIGHIAKLNKAKFENAVVNGLPNFSIEHIKTSIFAMNVNITLHFPLLSIEGLYEIDGMFVSILPVFGKGPFHVYVKDVLAGGNAKLAASDGKMSLKTLQLHASIGHVDIELEGLMGGGDLGKEMNGLIQKSGNLLVRNLAPKLATIFSEFARTKLNNALKNMDIGGIIG